MKAGRRARDDAAGAETVGAMILFGLFVTTIAILNVTAVPNAGLAAETDHHARVLSSLNNLQAEAESAGLPGKEGATVARSVDLAPSRSPGQDFFSFFMATPAQASGELAFVADYGNLTLTHRRQGPADAVVDIGNPDARFPVGRLTFDPHPVFRSPGVVQVENGGIVATTPTSEAMRFAPPVSVSVAGGVTHVTFKARVLNGTDATYGGTAPLRVGLATEAATLTSPASENANEVTLRMETAYGTAWGRYLNETSTAAGATYATTVAKGAGEGGLDVVTWHVAGADAGTANDIRLTYGLAVYAVTVS